MASKFLGKVGDKKNIYEIHALTNGHKFREIAEPDISDPSLYRQILKGRYQILANGNAIYCTAVNPIEEEKIEYNPHDDREGTIHLVAVDNHGEVEAALAVAVDIGDTENGTYVGVPLENRWKKGDYPLGDNLDKFRKNYVRLNHNENRDILPYEMAELYRHFKRFGKNNTYARLGLYCGLNHLLVREAHNRQKTATLLWLFDAIPQYFNLYRYAGAAVLRDFTLRDKPKFISPSRRYLLKKSSNGSTFIEYRGEKISRSVPVPAPYRKKNGVKFKKQETPFLDGVVDLRLLEKAIQVTPNNLTSIHFDGFTEKDKNYLNETLKLLMRRSYTGNRLPLPQDKNGQDIVWNFNGIGI